MNFPRVGLFFKNISRYHADIDECAEHVCGPNTLCFNTNGSYSCACQAGFRSENHTLNCTGEKQKKVFSVKIILKCFIDYTLLIC